MNCPLISRLVNKLMLISFRFPRLKAHGLDSTCQIQQASKPFTQESSKFKECWCKPLTKWLHSRRSKHGLISKKLKRISKWCAIMRNWRTPQTRINNSLNWKNCSQFAILISRSICRMKVCSIRSRLSLKILIQMLLTPRLMFNSWHSKWEPKRNSLHRMIVVALNTVSKSAKSLGKMLPTSQNTMRTKKPTWKSKGKNKSASKTIFSFSHWRETSSV